MSLATNITNLATRVATEVKSIRTLVNGNVAGLTALDTTAKTNLVAAINELKSNITAIEGDLADYISANDASIGEIQDDITAINGTLTSLGEDLAALEIDLANIDLTALINDAATATDTTWSSTKIDSEIGAAVDALVAGAPGLLDTLNELAAALGDDANFAATITAELASKSDVGHGHVIADVTGLQSALDSKANAADVGDTSTNYVTTFEAGLL
jgi:hypothetical protein